MNPLRRSLIAVLVIGLAQGNAWAAPQGGQVVSGQASISRQGNLTTITNSPGAILQWQSFSIGAGEIARFNQQSASSSVLNRVVGQDPSQILGSLQSNGRVFLINPNGILFGPGAKVDVNGLVASTLALSNQDFLAGRLNFSAGEKAGAVVNQGSITTPAGGRVYLVAPSVENSGVITTPQGATLLAAGRQVSLVDSANPYVDVIVSAPADRALNVGEVVAAGGSIGVYGALINQRGRLDADSMVVGANGKIVLKASGDTLLEAGSRTSARGAGKGGEIQVLGERVALTGDAKVDASGKLGGGTVLAGGDYQGKNAAVQNAKQTYIGSDAEIRVDALESGDGGKAIAWSDGLTRVHGFISARGGDASGDGGFVETSGKVLDMQGRVDTRAPNGKTGVLLLDPTNIFIADNLANALATSMMIGSDASADSSGSPFSASGAVRDSLLTTGTLMAALATSSVVVTTDNASGSGDGFINVVDSVSWSAPNSLTLNAGANVFGNGTISGASLIVNAHAGINLHTQVARFSGTDTGSDTSIVLANTGNLTLGNITQSGFAGGGINITNNAGTLIIPAGSTISASGPGNVMLASASGVVPGGTVITAGSGVVTVSGPVVSLTPPPSADICTIAPNSALCQVLSPPTASEPNKPVQQATNEIIRTINASTSTASTVQTRPVAASVPSTDTTAEAAARDAAKAADAAATAMAAAQAAAKAAADVAAKAAAYEAAEVAKATQLAASASTDSATVAKAAAAAAEKAAADTAAMKAKADADAQAALDAAVRAKSDADTKSAAAEKAKEEKKDDKKEDKKSDTKEVASTDKSGTKNEPAKKTYCN